MPTLHWIGKEKVINHHLDVPFHILQKKYTFKDNQISQTETSENKIIHGDNLLALKSLLPQYEGKIKCIYIDPPYNTGNEGWVYNDNVNDPKIKKWLGQVVGKEAEDLTRHDKWLCMMYPRLKLLHKLLAEDGAIFISINEDEQASLKLICDEIFGASNYLTMFTIKLRHEERILKGDKDFHEVTEQLYLYRKSYKFKTKKKEYDNTSIDEYIFKINIIDDSPEEFIMDEKSVKGYKPNQYEIIKGEPNIKNLKKINIRGTLKDGNSSGRFYMKHLDSLASNKYSYLFAVPDMGDDGTGNRYFLLPKNDKKQNGDYFQGVPINRSDIKEVPYPNYFDFTDEFNRVGYEGGKIDFRFGKKPIKFLQKVFEIAGIHDMKECIILDSFAGSGSTGDAVLNLNKQDGGNRKFILVEMEDYAENITAERIRRVGGNFEFYELDMALFDENGFLNEQVGIDKIREYVYFTETHEPLSNAKNTDNQYFLDKYSETAYYFYYEKDSVTNLDYDFLGTVITKAEQYVIYADNCLLPKEFLSKHHIIFKKIPRDITKL